MTGLPVVMGTDRSPNATFMQMGQIAFTKPGGTRPQQL
jgi:hypothetical protein